NESQVSHQKWYPYNKGGTFRRWYGNHEYVVNWKNDGEELKDFVEELNKLRPGGRLKNQEYYFLECINYSSLSSGFFSARYTNTGFLFDTKGSGIFPKDGN
ncbi:class I SAM-dependent DNA methyltransferase, partial [Salmonella enterica subsp. enterica serovar Indiana]|nr:class I SAM-dependent DNA methyltransferase [Salmonella enterica subsp. enterica serovar Indiana]